MSGEEHVKYNIEVIHLKPIKGNIFFKMLIKMQSLSSLDGIDIPSLSLKISLHLCGYSKTLDLGHFETRLSTGWNTDHFQDTSVCFTFYQTDLCSFAVQLPLALCTSLSVLPGAQCQLLLCWAERSWCVAEQKELVPFGGWFHFSSSFLCCFYSILSKCNWVVSYMFNLYL